MASMATLHGNDSHFSFTGMAMHAMNTDEGVGDDLIAGGKEIAAFWGMPERKCRHLLARHQLPGAFQIGSLWYQSKSAAREAIKALASASNPWGAR
jgi:hypothetical protein